MKVPPKSNKFKVNFLYILFKFYKLYVKIFPFLRVKRPNYPRKNLRIKV